MEQTATSAAFGIAAMILAAKTIFSQVLPTLITLTPSGLVLVDVWLVVNL